MQFKRDSTSVTRSNIRTFLLLLRILENLQILKNLQILDILENSRI